MAHVRNEVIDDLKANGPATPAAIANRLGKSDATEVWRHLLRMANAGQVTFDPTGRIATLAEPEDQGPF